MLLQQTIEDSWGISSQSIYIGIGKDKIQKLKLRWYLKGKRESDSKWLANSISYNWDHVA
jgi:hypothetical protein